MAITIEQVPSVNAQITEGSFLGMKARLIKVTMDSDYAADGEAVTAAALGWDYILGGWPFNGVFGITASTTAFVPELVVSDDNQTLYVRAIVGGGDGALMEEDAGSTDLSDHFGYLIVLGT